MIGDRRGDAYMNSMQPALATCPWFPIIGNHESDDGDSRRGLATPDAIGEGGRQRLLGPATPTHRPFDLYETSWSPPGPPPEDCSTTPGDSYKHYEAMAFDAPFYGRWRHSHALLPALCGGITIEM